MKRKLLIMLLCCSVAVLCLSALSGCAAPGLDDVFANVATKRYAEINMNVRLESNGQNTDVATVYLYGEGNSAENVFIHMVIDADDSSQAIYINKDYFLCLYR